MNQLGSLLDKPWLALGTSSQQTPPREASSARTALGFLLAIISVVFFLLILTLLSRSQFPDFQALAGAPWQPLTDAQPLWINSTWLACASLALQTAYWLALHKGLRAASLALFAASLFSLLFLLGQLWLWNRLAALGYVVANNPANSYFYLLTGAHAVHLLGGLIALALLGLRLRRTTSTAAIAAHIGLCARYWHFLLALWLLLFWLLTASADTFNAIAQLCGL